MARLRITEKILGQILGLSGTIRDISYDFSLGVIMVEFANLDFPDGAEVEALWHLHRCEDHEWVRTEWKIPGFTKAIP